MAENAGSLRGYRWEGTYLTPNTGFDPPSDTLHLTSGSSVEFAARLGEQPSHHLITIENATDPANDEIVIEDVRLHNNTFVVDLDTGKYVVSPTGVWVKMTYPVKTWIW